MINKILAVIIILIFLLTAGCVVNVPGPDTSTTLPTPEPLPTTQSIPTPEPLPTAEPLPTFDQ